MVIANSVHICIFVYVYSHFMSAYMYVCMPMYMNVAFLLLLFIADLS